MLSSRDALLFTDIEDSTGLLDRLGDRYQDVLDDVRTVIGKAVAEAGGRDVEVRADEHFAVFEQVEPAIEAALVFQRGLFAHVWPDGVDVLVRAGIHTGEITMTSSGYIGLPVHEASRLCAAGHGGQILVTGATLEATECAELGIEFRELGAHQLRGMPSATEIHQIEAEGLAADFPPLRLGQL